MGKNKKILIIGAGPAGLASAYEFCQQKKLKDFQITIYEKDSQVGGISKTLIYKGYRFDLGGHRFYTKINEVNELFTEFLKNDFLTRKRLSRIYYDGKFYNYPLSISNALGNLGVTKSFEVFFSWLLRQFNKYKVDSTFDKWVSNRFGDKLFQIFFKSYTEKLWGISTSQLSSDWAVQRIQGFNLFKAIVNAIFGIDLGERTIISSFSYPKYGPGMFYERMKEELQENGIKILLNKKIINFVKKNNKVSGISVKNCLNGKISTAKADYIISTMPFNQLISFLTPPKTVLKEAKKLRFRNFITVNLIIETNPFPDQWIYVHDTSVRVGRIQNFRNWSQYMVKENEDNTPIGMEYFASVGDDIWQMKDRELITLAKEEINKIGLVSKKAIKEGFVYRVEDAYPIYNCDYNNALSIIRDYVNKYENLYLCGRGGLFRYNNQDHSILTGLYSARNIIAGKRKYDIWSVNKEKQYIEKK